MSTPATVYISESNGAGEVVTDNISNINFGSVDQPNIVAANHPIIQSENGYWKAIRFRVASLGTSTTIQDFRVWKSAGVLLVGETIDTSLGESAVGINGGYVQPSQIAHADISNPIPTSDPGTANVLIANSFVGTLVAPGYSNYFYMQLKTTGAVPVGPVNQKTILLQYDET